MEEKEAAELLASYGLKEPGLNRLIRATYDLMGLTSFFTAGEPEVRAWTIRKGANAVKAAGAIHSDIEKGFIRAEVVQWSDLLAAGSLAAAREKAQVQVGGKGIYGAGRGCDFVPAQRVRTRQKNFDSGRFAAKGRASCALQLMNHDLASCGLGWRRCWG